MSPAGLARFYLPRLDPRPETQIARDLDDEFAFHLEQLEREFVDAGGGPAAARAAAIERFGDVASVKAECRCIALEERIMLQRINFVLMVVVLAAVVLMSLQLYLTHRSNAVALEDITVKLAQLQGGPVPVWALPVERGLVDVIVGGDIGGGPVALAADAATLVQAITRAGGLWENTHSVKVLRVIDGFQRVVAERSVNDPGGLSLEGVELERGDMILATALRPAPNALSAAPQPQGSVLLEGEIDKPGWYPVSLDGATYLHEVLQRAGVQRDQWILYSAERGRGTGGVYAVHQLLRPSAGRIILGPGDRINVFSELPETFLRRPSGGGVLAGSWHQVEHEDFPGTRIEIDVPPPVDRRRISNLDMLPRGTLMAADGSAWVGLRFYSQERLIIFQPGGDGKALGIASWRFERREPGEHSRLVLDLSEVVLEHADPIVLVRQEPPEAEP